MKSRVMMDAIVANADHDRSPFSIAGSLPGMNDILSAAFRHIEQTEKSLAEAEPPTESASAPEPDSARISNFLDALPDYMRDDGKREAISLADVNPDDNGLYRIFRNFSP